MHSHKAYKNRKHIENINTQAKDEIGFFKNAETKFYKKKKNYQKYH